MGLDNLTCDICGMRYGDVELYHLHVDEAHREGGPPLREDRLPMDGHRRDEEARQD